MWNIELDHFKRFFGALCELNLLCVPGCVLSFVLWGGVFWVLFCGVCFFFCPSTALVTSLGSKIFIKQFSSIICLFFTCAIKPIGFSAACCDETSGVQVNRNYPTSVPNERHGLSLVLKATIVNDCQLLCYSQYDFAFSSSS